MSLGTLEDDIPRQSTFQMIHMESIQTKMQIITLMVMINNMHAVVHALVSKYLRELFAYLLSSKLSCKGQATFCRV